MAIPHFPRRRRLWTLMIVVAACAVGLGADRSPVDRLIEQLRTGDAPARSQASRRIGLLGPRAAFAVGALDSALDDPDPQVRANAMYSLVRLGSRSPRLLPTLVEQIEATPMPHIGADGNPEALAILAGLIETPGWTVGPRAAWELARLGPKAKPAKPALVKALMDPRQGVRSNAREALARIGGP
jgi:HEAT repeat protein